MFATRILATAGTLTMAAALLGGLASSAQASTVPVIYGVITGPHIRPETPGYGPNVTVTSVSGQIVTTGGTFLPLNTKGVKTAFATISGAPVPV